MPKSFILLLKDRIRVLLQDWFYWILNIFCQNKNFYNHFKAANLNRRRLEIEDEINRNKMEISELHERNVQLQEERYETNRLLTEHLGNNDKNLRFIKNVQMKWFWKKKKWKKRKGERNEKKRQKESLKMSGFSSSLKGRNLSVKLSQDRTFSVVLSQDSSLLEEEIEKRFAEGWGNWIL